MEVLVHACTVAITIQMSFLANHQLLWLQDNPIAHVHVANNYHLQTNVYYSLQCETYHKLFSSLGSKRGNPFLISNFSPAHE